MRSVAQISEFILDRLPLLGDDVAFRLVDTSDQVFVLALAKRPLPYRERFIQAMFGTWGMSDDEIEEMLDEILKGMMSQDQGRGFFVYPEPAGALAEPDPVITRELELEKQIATLRAENARLRNSARAATNALSYLEPMDS